jgi:hypothetical protein
MKKLLVTSICILINLVVCAQNFQRVPNVDLRGGYLGFASWCDYNSDGFLDIFVTGEDFGGDFQHAELYKNNGDNTFSESAITHIPRVIYGDQSWGDFDNNGTPDLLYAGTRSGSPDANITRIYKNIGGTNLSEIPCSIPGLDACHVEWVDVNNDGLLDIYYQGINSGNQFDLGIYRNEGHDSFIKVEIEIFPISGTFGNFSANSAKWADFDNDGLKDVIIAMSSASDFKFEFYKNLGGFKFQKVEIGLPHLNYVRLAVGDINQDGLMDIVFIGSTKQTLTSSDYSADVHVFINNGGLNFDERFIIDNVGAFINTLQLGDMDNDGFSDILLYGTGGYNRKLKIFKNNHNCTFSSVSHPLIDSELGGAQFGDFDNDNDLDILYYGRVKNPNEMEVTYVYENKSTISNSKPMPTDSIGFWAQNDDLQFNWNNGNDDATLPAALYYNLSIGTATNPDSLVSGCALSDKLKTVTTGNMDQAHTFMFTDFPEGNYQAKIQAIDHSYNASVFSDIFSICFKKTEHLLGDTISICEGDSVILNAGGNYPAYLWNTGSTNPAIYAKTSGLYNVNLTHPDGCISSETVFVKVNDKPVAFLGADTTITLNDTLVLKAGAQNATYLWSDNSQNDTLSVYGEIEGAGIHTYWLKVTSEFGCITTDTIIVTVKNTFGISSAVNPGIKIYPVPIRDAITIESNTGIKGKTQVQIRNVQGVIIWQHCLDQMNSLQKIALPALIKGVYFLLIDNESNNFHKIFKVIR